MSNFKIYNKDSRNLSKFIQPNSVHFVIFSPPYWNLRNYKYDNQIGFKQSYDEYLKDMKKVFSYECELHDYTLEQLKSINDFKIYGNSKNKGSLISFNIEGFHHNDVALLLNQKNIAIRSGHHCAQPLMKKLNIAIITC